MRACSPKRQRARDNDHAPPTTKPMTTTRQRPASSESALAKVPANIRQASTSLQIRVSNVDELKALARVFAVSGMFGTANNDQTLAKCAVQLMAGMEAGFTPFASITGIYVINGKPGFSAQLLAQAIKRHPHYDYRVLEKTANACTIRFLLDGEILGEEKFTIEMAVRAGLTSAPWKAYPEAMLFARCLTAGMRTHCPDALGGQTPYTPEELGAPGQIDEDGMVVATVQDVTPSEPDRDALQTAAIRKLKEVGVTTAGLKAMLNDLGDEGCKSIGQLADDVLIRLAKSGAKPETVARWNETGSMLVPTKTTTVRRIDPAPLAVEPQTVEPEPEVVDDDEPMLWAGGEK
jgi:hypothetical protein